MIAHRAFVSSWQISKLQVTNTNTSGLSACANRARKDLAASSASVAGLSSPASTFSLPFTVSTKMTNVPKATFQMVRRKFNFIFIIFNFRGSLCYSGSKQFDISGYERRIPLQDSFHRFVCPAAADQNKFVQAFSLRCAANIVIIRILKTQAQNSDVQHPEFFVSNVQLTLSLSA